jgi:hypothetical protein
MKTIRDEHPEDDNPKADRHGGDDPECAGTLLPLGWFLSNRFTAAPGATRL